MRVLVVGGAGFVGSHACKALGKAGHEPIVFDNLVTGHADAVKWGPLVEGDLLDSNSLDAAFSAYKPDMVMHFAAYAYVGESVTDPAKYYRNNVCGSLNLLDSMLRHDVGSIVFSSTCATYGNVEKLPIDETMPQNPINPYGFTKLAIEHALADYGNAYGVKSCALRYFNAAGADPEGELGERHDPETHVIPLAIQAALGEAPPLSVFGSDYDTPDGSAIRDYVHVSDLADAHLLAIDYLQKGGKTRAFNLATGKGTTVLQLIAAVERATGRKVPYHLAPRRAGDPPALLAVAEQARLELGWIPRYADLDHLVGTASDWFLRQHNR